MKGETNFVADALSRPSVSVIDNTSAINYKELNADRALDAEFTRLRHSTSPTMNFQLLKSFNNHLIWCDMSTGHNRPYLTERFQKTVFLNLHRLGHPSHWATKPLINTRFVWHGMNIDIANWCRSCKGCQTANSPNLPRDLTTYTSILSDPCRTLTVLDIYWLASIFSHVGRKPFLLWIFEPKLLPMPFSVGG